MKTMHAESRSLGVGFLLVQIVIGYEWLSSGLTKVVHGDFTGGLAADLRERGNDSYGWYKHFLNGVVIPHASAWGYVIEIAEIGIGVVLIASALVWLIRPGISRTTVASLAGMTALASLGGLLLALNLTFANGYGVGPVGPDSFDEGITLDVLLIGIQTIILGVSLRMLVNSRRPALAAVPQITRRRAA